MISLKVLLVFFLLVTSMLKASVVIPWPEIKEIYFPYLVSQETLCILLNSFSVPSQKDPTDGTIFVGRISGKFSYFQINRHKAKKRIIWVNFNLETDLSMTFPFLDERGRRCRCSYTIIERKYDGRRQKLVSIYHLSRGGFLLEFDLNFWLKHVIYEIFPFLMARWQSNANTDEYRHLVGNLQCREPPCALGIGRHGCYDGL